MQVGDHLDPAELIGQRWFAAPTKPITAITVEERFDFVGGGALAILRVDIEGGSQLWRSVPTESSDGSGPWLGLLELVASQGVLSSSTGSSLAGYMEPGAGLLAGQAVRPLGRDQSHTSVVVDETLVIKLYRSLTPGMNIEIELGQALVAVDGAPVPRYRGAVSLYRDRPLSGRERIVVAFLQDFVPNAGDAFVELADRLAAWLRAGAPQRALPSLIADGTPSARAIARLHAALAVVPRRHFVPRPARPDQGQAWRRSAARVHRTAERLLRSVDPMIASWLVRRRDKIDGVLDELLAPANATLQRIHGDLHLGQLLRSGDDFLIADLEGEPGRSAMARRRLDTPLRDLASMLRSFDHVARSGMRRSGVPLSEIVDGTSAAEQAIDAWLAAMRSGFLVAYAAEAAARELKVDINPRSLHALEVEKELSEFRYAATYLPAWMYAPSAGMRWLLDR